MIDAVCFKCRANFALTNDEYDYLETSGANFFCPICGQIQHYTKGSAERLKAAYLQRLSGYKYVQGRKQELDRENEHLRAQVRGLRGYITRMKRART